ncbi:exodeoxyribonuclease VII large subunit [Mesoplasma photuris]|uniref:exodeoxyribonuclease VII large subunit n=1 Tax=Mesoplasma photuris TaxID=217731 RepID=UPI0004E1C880|nr:exodeoxyribonuclease VII large subunit [Mesoplasma photuris]
MEQFIFSVKELNSLIKEGIENNNTYRNINVTGEISNLTFNKSGHIYFSIKDTSSSINCMIWSINADKLRKINPKEGMKITCTGRLTYYIPTGRVSFEVNDIKLDGIGELQIIYQQRREQLAKDGWFDNSLKKPITKNPKAIGIVTADTGAAVHDLITTIKRRMPSVDIFLFPSQVQGEKAQFDIAAKIKQANNFEIKLDTLIVGRGGGSYEDLWSFNEMAVLEAIRNSNIPIISAVGHEPDFTLADEVADLRAATPTAAGEIATSDIQELIRDLAYHYQNNKKMISNLYRLHLEIINKTSIEDTNKLKFIIHREEINFNRTIEYFINNTKNIIKHANNYMENLQQTNFLTIDNILNKQTEQIKNLEEKNQILNPKKPLEKGFVLLRNQNKNIIKSVNDLNIDEEFELELKDGKIKIIVKEINHGK